MLRDATRFFLRISLAFCHLAGAETRPVFSEATYLVPVEDKLCHYAHFPVTGVEWEVSRGRTHLKYNMPPDLVLGVPTKIQMQGPALTPGAGFIRLKGQLANAACTVTETRVVCLVQYGKNKLFGTNVSANKEKIRGFLETQHGENQSEIEKRTLVATSFHHDPGGIFTLPFKCAGAP